MEMNGEKISSGQVFSMFLRIKSAEQKNVRTQEYSSKEMVAKLTKYIEHEAQKIETDKGGEQ